MRFGALKNKGPHRVSGEGFWIVAKNLEKIDKRGLIGFGQIEPSKRPRAFVR
jgi:hypothetical protein